jgi:hypothetical protein
LLALLVPAATVPLVADELALEELLALADE